MYVPISTYLPDTMSILTRLRLDDMREETKGQYTDNMKADYKYTKYYLDGDNDEIIIERIFCLNVRGHSSWFGIPSYDHGMFHFYQRPTSAFSFVARDTEDVGILFKQQYSRIIVYSIDDTEPVENTVKNLFENMEDTIKFMVELHKLNNKFVNSILSIPRYIERVTPDHFYNGLVILEV
jgi:hypothetical protein